MQASAPPPWTWCLGHRDYCMRRSAAREGGERHVRGRGATNMRGPASAAVVSCFTDILEIHL